MTFQTVVIQNSPGLSGVDRHNCWTLEVYSIIVKLRKFKSNDALLFKNKRFFFTFFLDALVFVQELEGHELLFLYVYLTIMLDKCLFLKK